MVLPQRSGATLQLSTRCSSLALSPRRSLPVFTADCAEAALCNPSATRSAAHAAAEGLPLIRVVRRCIVIAIAILINPRRTSALRLLLSNSPPATARLHSKETKRCALAISVPVDPACRCPGNADRLARLAARRGACSRLDPLLPGCHRSLPGLHKHAHHHRIAKGIRRFQAPSWLGRAHAGQLCREESRCQDRPANP
jgi:hypothetical protein